ncbi:MAG: transporter substrate-binding domain-containing protein [Erysipelotrichaceae bacterium]|nr:transporter substrate-binding domain-containing protein [Erysipelotrichaceae bacterium]
MKRLFKTVIMLMVAVMLVSCGNKNEEAPVDKDSDIAYIQGKGTPVVGITDFAPMDYKEDGEWTGFDAEIARKVAADLGVDIEFVEIEWDNKIFELDNKSIDCVWNGMTLTDEVRAAMECGKAYCNNSQVVVMNKDRFEEITDIEGVKDLQFAVEAGSAGEAVAKDNGFSYVAVTSQADTLLEVSAGTCDAAIIDMLMASAMTGEGKSYSDLAFGFPLTDEEYGVGCRKGSDLTAFINDEFKKFYDDGSLYKIAGQFGLEKLLVAQ